MRHACWYHDHIAFTQMMRFAALNIRAKPLTSFRVLAADHSTARDESGLAIGDVQNIGFFVVDFHLPGRRAMGALDSQIRLRDQHAALGQRAAPISPSKPGTVLGKPIASHPLLPLSCGLHQRIPRTLRIVREPFQRWPQLFELSIG